MYKNALGALPVALGQLKELNCINNKLLKLHGDLGGMAGLEEVNLAANRSMQLPTETIEWTSVKVFNVYGCRLLELHRNQVTSIPDGFFAKTTALLRLNPIVNCDA